MSAQVKAQLIQLQHQKDAIVDHIVARLPLRLRADALGKVRQHVAYHVKQRVKMRLN